MDKEQRQWIKFQIQMMERRGGFEFDGALRAEYAALVEALEEEDNG